ncbi:hypothetical protein M0805_009766 [Coniferiporia weirii]|nr:hypothetical protein M0805_009766 [Coniferiporia weirii]
MTRKLEVEFENLPWSAASISPEDLLEKTLTNLTIFNLTGRVAYDNSKPEYFVGAYSDVFTGSYELPDRSRIIVAVKTLRKIGFDIPKIAAREIYIWSKLIHPNISLFLGFVNNVTTGLPSLVSEWMENGTVLEYVKKHPERDVLHLILGMAKGLEYLHDNGIVHSDIKSDNVLIDASGEAVICDFGISRAINATQAALGGNTTAPGGANGAYRWMARELFDPKGGPDTKHTKETDIWAFGMTIYEILTKDRPYAHVHVNLAVPFTIMEGGLPVPPAYVETWPERYQDVWRLCGFCWISDPQLRISMANVVKKLSVAPNDAISLLRGTKRVALVLPSNSKEKGSRSLLQATLFGHRHLNLTGHVNFDVMGSPTKENQHCKIYIDNINLPGREKVLVATRRLNFHVEPDFFAEVGDSVCVHLNILPFLGFVLDENGLPSLVSEWMTNGSALEYIKGRPDCNIMRLICGAAEGLAYLHENGVVHESVKPDNVLVTSSGDAVICDIGVYHAEAGGILLSEEGESGHVESRNVETVRWLAYELLCCDNSVAPATTASDVWSFGLTVYALLTKELPYAHIIDKSALIATVTRKETPSPPAPFHTRSNGESEVWKICESCWVFDPQKRISMAKVAKILKILKSTAYDEIYKAETLSSGDLVAFKGPTHTQLTPGPKEDKFRGPELPPPGKSAMFGGLVRIGAGSRLAGGETPEPETSLSDGPVALTGPGLARTDFGARESEEPLVTQVTESGIRKLFIKGMTFVRARLAPSPS